MTGKVTKFALAGALLAGMSVPAMAESTTDVQSEIASLKAELAQLRAQQNDQWLTERRSEEIKGLVKEVLADAETRTSLLADGATAGIDEKGKIFLQSADGSWYANINGQIQVRYIWNNESDRGSSDGDTNEGMQFRRVKVGIKGYIGDPKIKYALKLSQSRSDGGSQSIDDVKLSYKFSDWATVQAGYYKAPFLRQELNSSSRQLAVERSSVNEAFTLNKAQQIGVKGGNDTFQYEAAYLFTAGDNYSDFDDDVTASGDEESIHTAFAGRVVAKVMGDWKAYKDYNGWRGKDAALFVGGAVALFNLDDGSTDFGPADEYLTYTLDASYQANGLTLSGAYMANTLEATGAGDVDQNAFLLEAAYFVTDELQPYIRYEFGDDDTAGTDDLEIWTVGANYYVHKHSAKFTVDVAYKAEGDFTVINDFGGSVESDSLGFNGFANDEEQIALRIQFQLLF